MLPFCDRHVCIPRCRYLPSHNRGIPVPKQPETIGGHLRRRRLQLKILQREAARRLGVSTVSLSRWERDAVYPTWPMQPRIKDYLGYDPFTDPALGHPGGNKPPRVAFLSSSSHINIGQRIVAECIKARRTRKEFAQNLGISPKTIWNWSVARRKPSRAVLQRIAKLVAWQGNQ
jgi:transcriptional regulator with XRE-family HTH domain